VLVRAFLIEATLIPALFACSASGKSEPNTLTCVLERAGSELKGSCEVPCSVNALAIDIDGPNPKKACESPARSVQATLRETGGTWLGTMQGKFPEDPTRFEVVMPNTEKPGIAKTPFGWFALEGARRENETLTLTISANKSAAANAGRHPHHSASRDAFVGRKSLEQTGQPDMSSKPGQVEFVFARSSKQHRRSPAVFIIVSPPFRW
jgi:hypothetical protein